MIGLAILLLLATPLPVFGARQQIITISSGLPSEKITTGNGNIKRINYENLHAKNPFKKSFLVDKKIADLVRRFNILKDNLIVDFPNEDPKLFKPDLENYWYIVSKRGFLFNLAAITLMVFLFWVFSIRVGNGDCGGYKTIIRKPSKSDRVKIYSKTAIGAGLFFISLVLANVLIYKDRQLSKAAGQKLIQLNQVQYTRTENAIQKIQEINRKHIDIIYSSLSYERFKVGLFIKPLLKSYKTSIRNAEDFDKEFFQATSNHMYIRILVLVLTVSLALISFIYSYKNRVLTKSLMLSAGVGLIAVFALNTMNSQFNYWSVFVELCNETVKVLQKKDVDVAFQYDSPLEKIIDCTTEIEDGLLKEQLVSLMIAQNTILNILRNYFEIQNLSVNMNNYLDTADTVVENYDKLLEKIAEASKTSSIKMEHVEEILAASKDISNVFNDLQPLTLGEDVKEWASFYNDSICRTGLNFQFFTMFALFFMFVGIIVLCMAMFSAENVVRGLYNEEIHYVKTNKLRYDWN